MEASILFEKVIGDKTYLQRCEIVKDIINKNFPESSIETSFSDWWGRIFIMGVFSDSSRITIGIDKDNHKVDASGIPKVIVSFTRSKYVMPEYLVIVSDENEFEKGIERVKGYIR